MRVLVIGIGLFTIGGLVGVKYSLLRAVVEVAQRLKPDDLGDILLTASDPRIIVTWCVVYADIDAVGQGHYPTRLIMDISPRDYEKHATVKQSFFRSYEFATGNLVEV